MKQIIAFRSLAMTLRKLSFAVIFSTLFFTQGFVVFVSPGFAHCRPLMHRGYVVKELSAEC